MVIAKAESKMSLPFLFQYMNSSKDKAGKRFL